MHDYTVKEKNNIELERACLEGNLEKVIFLTTNTKRNESADINCGNNYPLKAACLMGRLEIVKFLLSHPNEKKRASISSSDQIADALEEAIDHGQSEVMLFFKSNYPNNFFKYMALDNHMKTQRNLNTLTMSGKLKAIKLLCSNMSPQTPIDRFLLLDKAIRYGHRQVFKYWLKSFSYDIMHLAENKKKVSVLINTAIYHDRLLELQTMVGKFNLNLSALISERDFIKNLEVTPESLNFIVRDCNYRPEPEFMKKITTRFNKMSHQNSFYPDWCNFMELLNTTNEKERLSQTIQSGNSLAPSVNKI